MAHQNKIIRQCQNCLEFQVNNRWTNILEHVCLEVKTKCHYTLSEIEFQYLLYFSRKCVSKIRCIRPSTSKLHLFALK